MHFQDPIKKTIKLTRKHLHDSGYSVLKPLSRCTCELLGPLEEDYVVETIFIVMLIIYSFHFYFPCGELWNFPED